MKNTNVFVSIIKQIIRTSIGIAMVVIMFSLSGHAHAATLLTRTLSPGTRNAQVRTLQTFLASNPDIYPSGMVTGYYGPLTKEAVKQFQLAYDISPVGYVGPLTLAKVNQVSNAGYGIDTHAPIISNAFTLQSGTGTTANWTTDTPSQAKIYYSTQPLTVAEAATAFTSPTINANSSVLMDSTVNTGHSITIPNLQAGTTYYYSVVATDQAGNVSMSWPSTFRQ
jgi:peptidoglycan hydrolase-like protein with peptidoglycan-binding domain